RHAACRRPRRLHRHDGGRHAAGGAAKHPNDDQHRRIRPPDDLRRHASGADAVLRSREGDAGMNSRAKIKDIAASVGVSPATVSRALTGTGLVAEPTLSRIREAAQKMHYRPNVSARNLRTQRSMAVLMVVRDVGNPFYLEILKGVETTAREAGYSVLMGNTENNPEREVEYFDMLRDGHADGMILMTGKLPDRDGYFEQVRKLPVVVAL